MNFSPVISATPGIQQFLQNIHWGQPNIYLFLATLLALYIFAPKKKRRTFMYLLTTVTGAVGFLAGGWYGLLTLSIAVCYRLFQNWRAPWQAIVTWTSATAMFTGLTLLIQTLDPDARKEIREGSYTGFGRKLVEMVDASIQNSVLLIALTVGGIAGTAWLMWWLKQKRTNPYRGMGKNVHADMMYMGRPNPDLQPIPETERDPKRSFPLPMRKEKLSEQKGLCAYQKRIKNHPTWEPYRSGVQWHGDHIIPHALGGATSYPNLQILCADCNSAKTDAYGELAIQKVEDSWKRKN